jgi:lichenan operon transcriptional antiterminator
MSDKYLALLELLRSTDDSLTASFLAENMGVSTRSVRSYVAAAKSAAHPYDIISATSTGYRLNRDAYFTYRSALDAKPESFPSTPREREHHIVHRLASSSLGLSIDDLSSSLHVSAATIESDIKRIRQNAGDSGVAIDRVDNVLTLRGDETELRRLLSTLIHDTTSSGLLSLDTIALRFDIPTLVEFKTDLIERLDYHRYFVNEYGIDSVLLHLAIAVDRVRNGLTLPDIEFEFDEDTTFVAGIVRELAKRHFAIELGVREEWYLARQLATRIITPGSGGPSGSASVDSEDVALTARAVELVYDEYLIDLRNPDLIGRLALHIGHLVTRAKFDSPSRNPLQKSIKSSYPLVWDIAVFIAATIQKEREITIDEDEISYIALHIGSHLERQAQAKNRVSATIVSPSYYDLHIVMRESIEKILGAEITIESVITRTDVRPSDITTDIVITTIPLPFELDTIVQVQPFLSETDIDAVRRVTSRARRGRRRNIIRERLLEYFRADTFFRNVEFESPESAIRSLGEALKSQGIIDDGYIESAIERERMSSTVFVDGLAVPHAMSMTAQRPTIAIAVNEVATVWGDQRVNVVAFIAFAASGREEFQEVFEQFVDVFSDRTRMADVVKNSTTFEGFIDTLVHVIDV